MTRKLLPLFLIALIVLTSAGSDKPAYRIFLANGKSADYEDILKEAKKADLIFFGEMHDNPICHWLEFELTKDIYADKKDNLIIGMEMFERDNQLIINEYLSNMIRKKDFEAEAKLWKNYATDYAPIMDYARENGIKVIATNVPRRYAAVVNMKGFEGLDSINAMERGLIAPLPIKFSADMEGYKKMKESMGPDGSGMHSSDNILKAQALKDATMAHFILKNGKEGMTFIHFNGSFHSDNFQGIVWYLRDFNKRNEVELKILVISSVEQESIESLDVKNQGLADFIITVPEDMTKTQAPASTGMTMSTPSPVKTDTTATQKK